MIDLIKYALFDSFDFGVNSRQGWSVLVYSGALPTDWHEALAISIFKWRHVVDEVRRGRLVWQGDGDTCGLCMFGNLLFDEFLGEKPEDEPCFYCPIYKVTGEVFCEGTYYYGYVRAYNEDDYAKALEAAEREQAFLEGLWSELPSHEEDHEDQV